MASTTTSVAVTATGAAMRSIVAALGEGVAEMVALAAVAGPSTSHTGDGTTPRPTPLARQTTLGDTVSTGNYELPSKASSFSPIVSPRKPKDPAAAAGSGSARPAALAPSAVTAAAHERITTAAEDVLSAVDRSAPSWAVGPDGALAAFQQEVQQTEEAAHSVLHVLGASLQRMSVTAGPGAPRKAAAVQPGLRRTRSPHSQPEPVVRAVVDQVAGAQVPLAPEQEYAVQRASNARKFPHVRSRVAEVIARSGGDVYTDKEIARQARVLYPASERDPFSPQSLERKLKNVTDSVALSQYTPDWARIERDASIIDRRVATPTKDKRLDGLLRNLSVERRDYMQYQTALRKSNAPNAKGGYVGATYAPVGASDDDFDAADDEADALQSTLANIPPKRSNPQHRPGSESRSRGAARPSSGSGVVEAMKTFDTGERVATMHALAAAKQRPHAEHSASPPHEPSAGGRGRPPTAPAATSSAYAVSWVSGGLGPSGVRGSSAGIHRASATPARSKPNDRQKSPDRRGEEDSPTRQAVGGSGDFATHVSRVRQKKNQTREEAKAEYLRQQKAPNDSVVVSTANPAEALRSGTTVTMAVSAPMPALGSLGPGR